MSERVLQGGYAPVNYARKKKPLFGRLHSRREERIPIELGKKPVVAPVPVESVADIPDDVLQATGLGDLSLDKDVVAVRPNDASATLRPKVEKTQPTLEPAISVKALLQPEPTAAAVVEPVEPAPQPTVRPVEPAKEKKNLLDVIKGDKKPAPRPAPRDVKKSIPLDYEETPQTVSPELSEIEDTLDEQEILEAIETVEAEEVEAAEVEGMLSEEGATEATETSSVTNQPSADRLAEFYDLNVKEFAALPTAEFIQKYKEYDGLIESLKATEQSLAAAQILANAARDTINIGKYGDDFQQSDRQYAKTVHTLYELASAGELEGKPGSLREIHEADDSREEAKKFLYGSLLSKLEVRDRRVNAIAHDKVVIDRFVELSKIIEESRLDRTPRQNIETIAEFFDTIVADIQAEVPAGQKELEDFRTKYNLHALQQQA